MTRDYFIILPIDINNHSTEPDRTNHICRYIDISDMYIYNMYVYINNKTANTIDVQVI